MHVSSYFSASYADARLNFKQACEAKGHVVNSLVNDRAVGVDGEILTTDIVRIGPDNAGNLLVLISGTHGAEGPCGSGVQRGLIETDYFDDLHANTAVLLVHAINPYGFSHCRRVNEDNIDLNRNFSDFVGVEEINTDYDKLHKHIMTFDWADREPTLRDIAENYAKDYGHEGFQAALTIGQYRHKDGVFFGGDAPSWSRIMFESLLREHAAAAQNVCVLDFHTGLGPDGVCEPITAGSAQQVQISKDIFGQDIFCPGDGGSSAASVQGTIAHGISNVLADKATSFLALEYGTKPFDDVMSIICADTWLYENGDLDSAAGKRIKQQVKEAFYFDNDVWKEKVWVAALEYIKIALKHLAAK